MYKPSSILFLLLFAIASGHAQADLHILNTINLRSGKVLSVDWHPDGNSFICGTEDRKIVFYSIQEANTFREIVDAHFAGVKGLLYTAGGDSLFSTGDEKVHLWDPSSGELLLTKGGNATYGWSLSYADAHKKIACGSFEKHFRIWDVTNEQEPEPEVFSEHRKSVLAVDFSPAGKYLASGSLDQHIFIWDWKTKETVMRFHKHTGNIYDLEYAPSGKYLASASMDNTIKIWNLREKKLLWNLEGHQHAVMSVSFSPDEHYLISGSFDQTIRIWETATGNSIYTYRKHEGPVNSVAFHPEGKQFVSTSDDGSVIRWKINKEIFVDFYYQEAFFRELKSQDLLGDKRKDESRSEYKERQQKAAKVKKELYDKYHRLYLEKRNNGTLPKKE